METIKCKSSSNKPNGKSKITRTFHKVINIAATSTKIPSSNNGSGGGGGGVGICIPTSQNKMARGEDKARQRAVLEALIAKLFASVTSIKAGYAELQMAQNPYNRSAIQVADQAIVEELKAISEMKQSFIKKQLHLCPQVSIMLAEIQEQQALMKTYEIIIMKLESQIQVKEPIISLLHKKLDESIQYNKSLDKKLNLGGSSSSSMFDNIHFSRLTVTNFAEFLQYTLRSMRSFVKLMIREMEFANWDLELAAQTTEPEAVLLKPSHRCFVFQSFVSRIILEGFNHQNFMIRSETQKQSRPPIDHYVKRFKKLKSLTPKHYLVQNPNSSIAKFTRAKYAAVIHAKMECSLFGNLNQRKLINSGGVPDSDFFTAFAEMTKRVWLLHSLAFSFGEDVAIYQVKNNCRFSEVYMDSVTKESLVASSSQNSDLHVSFTVVPGFKIGKNLIQSQVYLSPRT